MQTLNIHDAESILISPMQEHNTSRWITITIVHNEDKFDINLFPKGDLLITLEDPTHWALNLGIAKRGNANE